MSRGPELPKERGGRRISPRSRACPACASQVGPEDGRCASCGFTGADSIGMFSEECPPLLPVLDAVGLWDAKQLGWIETAREKLRRRFPQFQSRICVVNLPPDAALPVFGFWLLNVSPRYVGETDDDRAWTILLVINAATGHAAVVPGYSAERWIDDADWRKILAAMRGPWKDGRTADAVIRFLESSATFLEHSWRAKARRSNHTKA